jgi:uncharacterized protein YndB with AHSA1/START domain
MKTIKQKYIIKAPVERVWQALVDPKIISKWGGGPAKMDDKVGTEFKLWGGDIHGKNLKVVKNKELVQDWYSEDWEKPSKATFKLSATKIGTVLELIHENVPPGDVADIADGWKEYYLGPLKDFLEK